EDVAAGDIAGAIQAVQAHYERVGDRLLRRLAQEERYPGLRRFTDLGRSAHHAWVARTFGAALAKLRGAEQERLLGELVAVTDITMWKLLRRDQGLNREQTARALRELVAALLARATSEDKHKEAREDDADE